MIKIKAKELIGKKAVRTGPTESGDYSYTTKPLKIVNVTDTHIACEFTEESMFDTGEIHLFNKKWLDGKWTSYEEIVKGKSSPDISKEEILELLGFTKKEGYWVHDRINSEMKFDFSYAVKTDIPLFICREGMKKGLVDGRKQKANHIKRILNIKE